MRLRCLQLNTIRFSLTGITPRKPHPARRGLLPELAPLFKSFLNDFFVAPLCRPVVDLSF